MGTPPTAVFVGKLTVFTAALDGGFGWLVVLAAVNTVASLFYYLRWIVPAVRPSETSVAEPLPWAAAGAYVAAAGTLALGPLSGLVLGAL